MKTNVPGKLPVQIYPSGGMSVSVPGGGVVEVNKHGYPTSWIAPSWTYNSGTGLWSNTPVAGVENLSNPNFTGTYVDGLAPGWTKVGTPTVSESADSYDGDNQAQQVLNKAGTTPSTISLVSVNANRWVRAQGYGKKISGTFTSNIRLQQNFGDYAILSNGINFGTDYTLSIAIGRTVASGNHTCTFIGGYSAAADTTYLYDTASFKIYSTDQIIAYRNYGRQVSIASAFTLTTGSPGGVISRLSINGDGTFNYVMAWHDGTNLHLDTVVNSYTVVSKVNAAAAYGAGRIVKINFPSADVAQAFYNGVQIGADQDISVVPLGTAAGLFLPGLGTLSDPVIS